jgi:hypothetical protein
MEQKAFDLKELGNSLLGCLKAVAVPAAGVAIDWTAKGCLASNGAIVKGVGGVLVAIKPTVLAEVEKAVK